MSIGYNQYYKNFTEICNLRKFLKNIDEIKELKVIGEPKLSIIAVTSDVININILCDELKKKKWSINVIQNPNGFHFCLTSY